MTEESSKKDLKPGDIEPDLYVRTDHIIAVHVRERNEHWSVVELNFGRGGPNYGEMMVKTSDLPLLVPNGILELYDRSHWRTSESKVSSEEVLRAVAYHYRISVAHILGKSRTKEHTEARHMAMYLMSEVLEMSSSEIGKHLHKDHSTVLYAIKRMEERAIESVLTAEAIIDLKRTLGSTQERS